MKFNEYLNKKIINEASSENKYFLDLEVKLFSNNDEEVLKQAQKIVSKIPNARIKQIVKSYGGEEIIIK